MVIGFEREPPWLDSIQPYLSSLPPSRWIAGFILYYHVSPRSQLFAAPVSLYYPQGALENAGKLLPANHRRWWSRKQENLIGLSRFSSTILPRFLFIYLFIFSPLVNIYELLINKYPEIWNYNSLNFLYFFFFSWYV